MFPVLIGNILLYEQIKISINEKLSYFVDLVLFGYSSTTFPKSTLALSTKK